MNPVGKPGKTGSLMPVEEALARLKRSLGETVISGVDTTIPLFQKLLQEPDILSGDYDIHWLENYLAETPAK